MPSPRIPDELAAFLESGVAIVVATRDAEMRPTGAMACAVRVHDDRETLTLFLYEAAAREMAPNLEANGLIAADFDLPTSHRACQVKGTVVASRPAHESERALVQRQMEGFGADLELIGFPRAGTRAWPSWPCVAFDVKVRHVFEQTPGPGTGGPIA
jgi:hypothetical protein